MDLLGGEPLGFSEKAGNRLEAGGTLPDQCIRRRRDLDYQPRDLVCLVEQLATPLTLQQRNHARQTLLEFLGNHCNWGSTRAGSHRLSS